MTFVRVRCMRGECVRVGSRVKGLDATAEGVNSRCFISEAFF